MGSNPPFAATCTNFRITLLGQYYLPKNAIHAAKRANVPAKDVKHYRQRHLTCRLSNRYQLASIAQNLLQNLPLGGYEMPTAKTVLITGASSGIGAATAVAAAEAGYDVAIGWYRDRAGAEATAAKVRALGQRAVLVHGDVSNEDDVEDMFDQLDGEFDELGVLVNNAGFIDTAMRVEEMSVERLRRMFEVNAIVPFLCAKQAAIRMAWRYGGAGGVIINVSSIAARLGSAGQNVDYAASKGAVDVLTKGLGDEMAADRVRVVGVRPGVIDTPIHGKAGQPERVRNMSNSLPMQRAGTPREVADAILFLMSDKASYITGTSIDISGAR